MKVTTDQFHTLYCGNKLIPGGWNPSYDTTIHLVHININNAATNFWILKLLMKQLVHHLMIKQTQKPAALYQKHNK